MLLWAAKQNDPGIVTEPLWTPAISKTRETALRYVILEATQKQVSAALADAQIPALWLKGIALAHTVYPQPVLRPMGDLDVLVPYVQREHALRVVEGLGYHFYETEGQLLSSAETLHLKLIHHYFLIGGVSDSVILELHFQLLSTDNKLLPLDKLAWFATQTTLVRNSTRFIIPQPEAHLLYLSAHAILQHGEANTSLRQYFDIHQIIVNMPVDWDKLVEQAAMLGWTYAVERTLALSIQYFSTPVPDTVFSQLREQRTTDADATRALRLQGRGARFESMWMRLRELSFADRAKLIIRLMVPPRPYMRLRYGLRSDRQVWLYYPYRWFEVGQETAWAMWKRITRRFNR